MGHEPCNTSLQNAWVDHTHWRDSWKVVSKLQGGGQGRAWKVKRKHDGCEGFLKEAKKKKDPRFLREATAYGTFNIKGIPRLIESNAHRYHDKKSKSYIVTDFIDGQTVRQWRESQIRVELETAIKATRKLLVTLKKCHDEDFVHRDIKPDNIIFSGSDPNRPVLLDFGLSFRKRSESAFQTKLGEQVGNRFLQLPELAAGSPLKQDVRSDLSFAGGILFYLLTGQHPDVLQDFEGLLPHQRKEPLTILQACGCPWLPRLLSLFDGAFDPLIANRFESAEAMLESMKRVMEPRNKTHSEESLLQEIREAMDTEAAQRQEATVKRISVALREIFRVDTEVRRLIGGIPISRRSDYRIDGQIGKEMSHWLKREDDRPVLSTTYEVQEVGDEIVIQLSGEPIYRTSIGSPRYDDQFVEVIRGQLIDRLHKAVTNSK